MRCCVVVIEERHTSKSGIYVVLEALAAVLQANIVELAQLMPRISTPRRSCMHMVATFYKLHGTSITVMNLIESI